MPSNNYIDESQILLSVANDDISDADGIRIAVKVNETDCINTISIETIKFTSENLHSCRTYGI